MIFYGGGSGRSMVGTLLFAHDLCSSVFSDLSNVRSYYRIAPRRAAEKPARRGVFTARFFLYVTAAMPFYHVSTYSRNNPNSTKE